MMRPTALITGASSGIGKAFAKYYAEAGFDLVLVGRDIDQLTLVSEEVIAAGASCEICVADLSESDGVASVLGVCPEPDVVVANAGVTIAGRVGTREWADLEQMSYLLGVGVAQLLEGLVPAMTQRGSGDILIVSSIASLITMPNSAMYAASKSFVTAYGQSLAAETERFGIRVCVLCPGYVHTNLHERAGLAHLEKQVPGWMWISSDTVVQAGMKGLRRNKVVVVPGRVYRAVRPFMNSHAAQRLWRQLTKRH
ncbi:MAG: SDR family NAD(P)-dependent oxidoreductase [Ilumatobacteraceae bacterium]|nr:SDR family NAD(P)-dependent oxidoreductase [Ilumatobacteraceae bacterium]